LTVRTHGPGPHGTALTARRGVGPVAATARRVSRRSDGEDPGRPGPSTGRQPVRRGLAGVPPAPPLPTDSSATEKE
ncbi:hypothetical protein, partial [[Kitasatospora] papulosa]|uniref:hypothetical protein n=1 Tax=[Kitasatospora] papulosa TaxID=1464011 RepID=UPI0036924F97